MKMIKTLILLTPLLLLCSCQPKQETATFAGGHWIDLSYDFSEETVYWVNAEPFKRISTAEAMTDKGYFYAAGNYSAAEHGGTHIDAPIHFAQGKATVDQIPLDQLIAPAVKIVVSPKTAANRDYLITAEDIRAWESTNGQLPPGSIVLLETGFGKYWPDRKQYLGTDQRGDEAVKDLHFPGLDPKAAIWLVEERKIKAIGLDTASIDYGQSTTFDTHVALMTRNIPAFENVANLDKLPAKGFQVIALPMKIKGGSGGPLRIVAFVP